MSETTNIEWATHTGGPYLGCSRVSPGCVHCYAQTLAEKRMERIFRTAYQKAGFADWATRPVWGDGAVRVMTRSFWEEAHRLNRKAAKTPGGARPRMFPSLIDWLDTMPAGIIDQDGHALNPVAVLAEFLDVVRETPHLDWLLLTKRPENFYILTSAVITCVQSNRARQDLVEWVSEWQDGAAPGNVWLGTTVEDQKRADCRVQLLRDMPARVRFLSVEPLLEPVRLDLGGAVANIHWVICGGESGPGSRPMHPAWARDVMTQCEQAGVPFFFKQWGDWLPERQEMARERTAPATGQQIFGDGLRAFRVGKLNAGRLLDGVEYSAFPAPQATA